MAKHAVIQNPTFFWQGLLILLPVALLAVVGLISLRLDEQAAEDEARRRAVESARSLARAMRATVDDELHQFLALEAAWVDRLRLVGQTNTNAAFPDATLIAETEKWERDHPGIKLIEVIKPSGVILADGRRIAPPDIPLAPTPPTWFMELSAEQRLGWDHLRSLTSVAEIQAAQRTFFALNPSANARKAALCITQSPEQMIGDSHRLAAETGISFQAIACYRLLTTTNATLSETLLNAVGNQSLEHPSFVAPKLIELAEKLTNRSDPAMVETVARLRRYWEGQAQVRVWLDALRERDDSKLRPPGSPRALWVTGAVPAVLALWLPKTFEIAGDPGGTPASGPGYSVWFVQGPVIGEIFDQALAENKFLIPDYAEATVTIGSVAVPKRRPAELRTAESRLGGASQKFGRDSELDAGEFELTFNLTHRERMLSAERRRAGLFGALIAGAVLSALIGWLAAWRAFQRQLRLNEMKSNFVSSVSHELRAPIASVRLMAENLESGRVSEPGKLAEYFRFIVHECRRLSSLVENVLDFSRIEQGRKEYEFESTNIEALAQTTVKLMEPNAAQKGVTLEWAGGSPSGKCIELVVDGRAMQQALVNLIDNAVKHSAKGESVTVGIETDPGKNSPRYSRIEPLNPLKSLRSLKLPSPHVSSLAPSEGERAGEGLVRLFVSDHGPGIPVSEREKIFERFYRLGSELRRETPGVGIGLSIVKHIVGAHGGRVVVSAEPGGGSRFSIELPMGARK